VVFPFPEIAEVEHSMNRSPLLALSALLVGAGCAAPAPAAKPAPADTVSGAALAAVAEAGPVVTDKVRRLALLDALRNAAENGSFVVRSRTVVRDMRLAEQRVELRSSARFRSWTVVEEGLDDQSRPPVYRVTLKLVPADSNSPDSAGGSVADVLEAADIPRLRLTLSADPAVAAPASAVLSRTFMDRGFPVSDGPAPNPNADPALLEEFHIRVELTPGSVGTDGHIVVTALPDGASSPAAVVHRRLTPPPIGSTDPLPASAELALRQAAAETADILIAGLIRPRLLVLDLHRCPTAAAESVRYAIDGAAGEQSHLVSWRQTAEGSHRLELRYSGSSRALAAELAARSYDKLEPVVRKAVFDHIILEMKPLDAKPVGAAR